MNNLNRLRLIVAWIVVIAWVSSVVLDAAVPTYEAPATVHGIMLIVAGYLFGPTIMGRKKDDEQ